MLTNEYDLTGFRGSPVLLPVVTQVQWAAGMFTLGTG